MKVHLWAPGLNASEGGVQAYSNTVREALNASSHVCGLTVISRNDPEPIGPNIFCAGRAPGSLRIPYFSLLAAKHALVERPRLLFLTHLHFAPLAVLIRQLIGCKVWVALHGVEAWNLRPDLKSRALKKVDLLLPVSTYTQEQIARDLPDTRMRILANAVEASRFDIRERPRNLAERLKLSPDAKVLLVVSRLATDHQYKGIDQTLRALPQIVAAIPQAVFVIAGEGDDRARLEHLAEELGVTRHTRFTGKVTPEELPLFYNLCDVFVMPSTGEGFGIVYLEAMLSGKPVVAGNRNGALDAIRHGELGEAVDPSQPEQLAQVVIALLAGRPRNPLFANPTLLRQKTIEYFGLEKFRRELEGLLGEIDHPEQDD